MTVIVGMEWLVVLTNQAIVVNIAINIRGGVQEDIMKRITVLQNTTKPLNIGGTENLLFQRGLSGHHQPDLRNFSSV